MNQNDLLKLGKELLKQAKIEEAEIKAKKLLEYILNQSREEFIKNSLLEVPNNQEQKYKEKIEEIILGKPLQYITNNQEFMGLNFYVDDNVLIPQPDTEILVEQSIKIINGISQNNLETCKNQEKIQILDLCTGSGAIAISIAKYMQNTENSQIVASDISNKAIEIAKRNAIQNQVENIQFVQSDMFDKLNNYQFDAIISNPPYIETDTILTLNKEVQHEPKMALDGGKDGLDFYRIILKEASEYLKANGYILLEIGYNQGKKILDLYEELKRNAKYKLEIVTKEPIKDLGDNDRVLILKKA